MHRCLCLSETSGGLICYSFYVINADVLLQIPITNYDEKFTHEEFKYARVTYTDRRKMDFSFLSSAGSTFRSTFFFGQVIQLTGHGVHRKREIFHWLFIDVISMKLVK